jgi:hypothetical protein
MLHARMPDPRLDRRIIVSDPIHEHIQYSAHENTDPQAHTID